MVGEEFSDDGGVFVDEIVGTMDEFCGLFGDGARHIGVTMSEIADGDAGSEVQELVVLVVPDVGAFASSDDHVSVISMEDVLFFEIE